MKLTRQQQIQVAIESAHHPLGNSERLKYWLLKEPAVTEKLLLRYQAENPSNPRVLNVLDRNFQANQNSARTAKES